MGKRQLFKRKIEKSDVITFIVLTMLLALFVYVGFWYMRNYGDMSGGLEVMAENMKSEILSYGTGGVFLFVFFSLLHVIISPIPAALVQFVGGVIYDLWWGILISQIGIAIGTIISYLLSKHLGKRIVTLFASTKTINKIENLMSSKSAAWVLFAMFLLPGFPKDFLAYAVGLTNMKLSKLLIISATGRLPSIIVSTYLGANVAVGNVTGIIVTIVISCVVFALLYIFKNKLMALISEGTGHVKGEK